MVQNPSACFAISAFGPLQKFTFTSVASGAFTRICTRPAPSTRGYSAPQTFVVAGAKSVDSAAQQVVAINRIRIVSRCTGFVLIDRGILPLRIPEAGDEPVCR